MFRHPNYYKELRKLRNKLDQAISKEPATAGNQRSPGPGPKQAQAPSDSNITSHKLQATSNKRQAPSRKLQAPRFENHEKVSRCKDRGPGLR